MLIRKPPRWSIEHGLKIYGTLINRTRLLVDNRDAIDHGVVPEVLFVATHHLNKRPLVLTIPTKTPQNDTIAENRP